MAWKSLTTRETPGLHHQQVWVVWEKLIWIIKCYIPTSVFIALQDKIKVSIRFVSFQGWDTLLLSAGLDGKCKVWSVKKKQGMHTYVGHLAAVRDVQFNHDGTKFVSASFDCYL